ncbi:hypothetical protein DPMN_119107 [Dreissena polymorpha]|uniref:Uncharacterized protein n=1 Tax=Dreissena polymorpha TaxID=45954 RepID=A0A9D4GI28_DREPO|nr:hypothetical protein DPMN_119107 [Dreissena polymorpha]
MAVCYKRTSSDDTFEFIDTTDVLSVKLTGEASKHLFTGNQNNFIQMTEATSPTSKRTGPLTLEQFQGLRDSDGRLVDESSLRRAVFLGGIEPGARKEVWQYLFALYPCNSTKREREALLLDYIVKYEEMKSRWKEILKASAPPGGLVARYQLPDGSLHLSPDLTTAPLQYFNPDLGTNSKGNQTADFLHENSGPGKPRSLCCFSHGNGAKCMCISRHGLIWDNTSYKCISYTVERMFMNFVPNVQADKTMYSRHD